MYSKNKQHMIQRKTTKTTNMNFIYSYVSLLLIILLLFIILTF